MKRDLLTLAELSPSELELILKLSARFKERRKRMMQESLLKMRNLVLLFQKQSTRTRLSFEIAVRELGGNSVTLSINEFQLGRGETIEDTAAVLSRYSHAIMARVNRHDDIVKLARAASVPVVNGLSEKFHPVQILADLLTLLEHKRRLKGLRVAWVGDGDNVCNSWIYGAALSGIHFIAATPKKYAPLDWVVDEARSVASSTGGSIEIVEDPVDAARGADCVMTDTFVSMGFESERKERFRAFKPKYTVNRELMSYAKRDAVFEHCMPAHRGEEVTGDVIDGPRSVVLDQAENRLHTTKALLCFLMLGNKVRGIARKH